MALYNFNGVQEGTNLTSSTDNTVVRRGTVPCNVPPAAGSVLWTCPDAWITGSGGAGVQAFAPGKFGSALNVMPGLQNWGEWLPTF